MARSSDEDDRQIVKSPARTRGGGASVQLAHQKRMAECRQQVDRQWSQEQLVLTATGHQQEYVDPRVRSYGTSTVRQGLLITSQDRLSDANSSIGTNSRRIN